MVNQTIAKVQPDVIFSKYSAPMTYAQIDRPFVYMCDSTIKWTKDVWPAFSKAGFWIMEKWEAKSIRECDRIITFSQESAEVIKDYYQKDPEKVRVMPIPAFIPTHVLPDKNAITKKISEPFHLLLVGKRFHLRGIDIAIETSKLLNEQGYPTNLRIAGMEGEDQPYVNFMGMYAKENPDEMQAYFDLFNWADLLIHPSRFHSAGIVISEAAAFGLPTITNDAGGLATSVQNDLTGIVLPKHSPAPAYVDAIISLINDSKRYQQFRIAARKRFDEELSWEKAGQRLFQIIQEVL
jgi:glycosyltransferase involved in cell wall biosynthesis